MRTLLFLVIVLLGCSGAYEENLRPTDENRQELDVEVFNESVRTTVVCHRAVGPVVLDAPNDGRQSSLLVVGWDDSNELVCTWDGGTGKMRFVVRRPGYR